MTRYLIIGLLAFTSTAQADMQQIHNRLLALWTPVDQSQDDEYIDHSGTEPFTGDCDDYFTAAWNRLYANDYEAYGLVVRVRGTGNRHMMACADVDGKRVCLDPNLDQVSRGSKIQARYYDFQEMRP